MKLLTANFLTCAVKACKTSSASFPLHFQDAELEQVDMEYNPQFLKNLLPRIEWDALRTVAGELGFTTLPETKPVFPSRTETELDALNESTAMDTDEATSAGLLAQDEDLLRDLHKLLLETQVMEGKMVCRNCGHEYRIKEGIANFLLPSHLV